MAIIIRSVTTANGKFYITEIKARHPVGKSFSLGRTGKLVKNAVPGISEGKFTKRGFRTLTEFSAYLDTLNPSYALTYGLFNDAETGTFVSEHTKTISPDIYSTTPTRSRKNMSWGDKPGILLLDYDPPDNSRPLKRKELIDCLIKACPFLNDVEMLWRPSASSNIINGRTGNKLRGVRGQHVYIVVDNACQIEEIGKRISQRLWLAGSGRFDISKSGQLLERTIVDAAVWQPERLDFVGGSDVEFPLCQKKLAGVIIPGSINRLSLNMVTELTKSELTQVGNIISMTRQASKPGSEKKRARFIERLAKRRAGVDSSAEQLEFHRQILRAAYDESILYGDFVLLSQDGEQVTVQTLLDNPDQYNGKRFADPLEWDYNDDHRIAYAMLNCHRSILFSHAHGGKSYVLRRAMPEIIISRGDIHSAVDKVIAVLKESGDLYEDMGAKIMLRVANDQMIAVESTWLTDKIARLIRFKVQDIKMGKLKPTDPSPKIAETIVAKAGERGFLKLRAVCTAPTITCEGRIIYKPGYDHDEQIFYYVEGEPIKIPDKPTQAQVLSAYDILMKPFKKFPFQDEVSRGVFLAALLTAVMRPCLPTAPAFAFDAPTVGSGKTLLARCIGIIASGNEPDLAPPFENEAETKKVILSTLMKGGGVAVVDNITARIDSPSFAAALTAESYTDRILGKSQTLTVATNVLWLLTGNNIRVVGDLVRRVLICRIDPGIESQEVWKRRFDLNPTEYCREHRDELVVAALTIMSGFFASQEKAEYTRLATFEKWSESVCQAIMWLKSQGIDEIDDPVKSLDRQAENDPDSTKLSELLESWYLNFQNKPTTVSEAIKITVPDLALDTKVEKLKEAFTMIVSERGLPNARMLGTWIEKHQGKIISGKCFRRAKKKTGGVSWWFVEATNSELNDSHTGDEKKLPKKFREVNKISRHEAGDLLLDD